MKNLNEKRELAAAFRWFARLDMNEGIANHFSLAVSDDGQNFLMNPVGKFWSKIKSSDILELDARIEPKNIGPVVDETAWCIHGAIHRKVPNAKCIMHLHPQYSTALSCLRDPKLPALNQESMMFHNRVSYDLAYGGLGVGDEGERIASKIGNNSILMMGQHGMAWAGMVPMVHGNYMNPVSSCRTCSKHPCYHLPAAVVPDYNFFWRFSHK